MTEGEQYSVSEFIELMNRELDALSAVVIGEVSELKVAASGHRYFTLKDKDTGFILPCTIWARDYMLTGVELELGLEVAVSGKANFYGPFGKLSFNVKSIELVGEGALKQAYEKLKKKLTTEGLFDSVRKRPLPNFPRKIGIITSLHGAVIHDFSNNLGKYGFSLFVLNAKVEGPESGRELALSVRAMRTEDIDVLVIIRGGGSIQSLAGFDNEALVREIARFPVPVLAGVGHHQDVTLAAMASDFAESTPSLVATLINSSWKEASGSLDRSEHTIISSYESILRNAGRTIDSTFSRMKDALLRIVDVYERAMGSVSHAVLTMDYAFKRMRDTLASYQETIPGAYQSLLFATSQKIDTLGRVIEAHSPERQLKFGYSIVYNKGKVVRSPKDVKVGEVLEVQTADGTIRTQVSN